MSEENENGGGSIKSILIGLVSTVTLGVGGYITNKLTGGEDEEKTEVAAPAAAPVININNTNQQSQQQSAGKTIIIKEGKNEKATPVKVEEKPKKTETEKRKEDGLDW